MWKLIASRIKTPISVNTFPYNHQQQPRQQVIKITSVYDIKIDFMFLIIAWKHTTYFHNSIWTSIEIELHILASHLASRSLRSP